MSRDHIRILLYIEYTTRYSFPRTSQYMVVQEARVSRGGPRTTHSFNYKQTDYSRRKCRMFTAGFGMKETSKSGTEDNFTGRPDCRVSNWPSSLASNGILLFLRDLRDRGGSLDTHVQVSSLCLHN